MLVSFVGIVPIPVHQSIEMLPQVESVCPEDIVLWDQHSRFLALLELSITKREHVLLSNVFLALQDFSVLEHRLPHLLAYAPLDITVLVERLLHFSILHPSDTLLYQDLQRHYRVSVERMLRCKDLENASLAPQEPFVVPKRWRLTAFVPKDSIALVELLSPFDVQLELSDLRRV